VGCRKQGYEELVLGLTVVYVALINVFVGSSVVRDNKIQQPYT